MLISILTLNIINCDNGDANECTDGDGKNHDVCDVDERPDDADDSQAAGRDDVNVDQPVLEVVAEERRHDVRHTLGHAE